MNAIQHLCFAKHLIQFVSAPSSILTRFNPYVVCRYADLDKGPSSPMDNYAVRKAAYVRGGGCPQCFGCLGGRCVKHVEIHWQGSAVLNPPPPPEPVPTSERLIVKVFTAADPRKRGVELLLSIEPHETVWQLKERISKIEGTPADFQRFKNNRGKFIEKGDATLESVGIAHGMTLFVVLQPPVGTGFTKSTGCDLCSMAVGNVCTRHLQPFNHSFKEATETGDGLSGLSRHEREREIQRMKEDRLLQVEEEEFKRGDRKSVSRRSSIILDTRYNLPTTPARSRQGSTVDVLKSQQTRLDMGEEEEKGQAVEGTVEGGEEGRDASMITSPIGSPQRLGPALSPASPNARLVREESLLSDGGRDTAILKTEAYILQQPRTPPRFPSTAKKARGGCPLCEGSINGVCTRCIPRVGKGEAEPLDAKYKKALEAAKEAKLQVTACDQPLS